MHFLQRAFAISLCLWARNTSADDSVNITGVPSPGSYIIHEESSPDLSWGDGTIWVSSNVPVTIQRYSDEEFMEGSQPVASNYAHVLVTSDCPGTTYVPAVTWGEDSIDVSVRGAPSGGLAYLDPSSYRAEWSREDYWCRYRQRHQTTPAPVARLAGEGRSSSLRSAFTKSFERLVGGSVLGEETDGEHAEARRNLAGASACTVNAEVMVDGCSKRVDATAPSVRVVDSTLENTQYESSSADPCITNMSVDIMFDSQARRNRRNRVRKVECHRAVPGRPFVDSSGRALQASELIVPVSAEEGIHAGSAAGDDTKVVEPSPSTFQNSTIKDRSRLLLGREWTKNALGEHASVASFAAFSIALMTNGAPAELVRDAIDAALDETRHAESSFAIASRLTRKEVAPGPLPESNLVFDRNLTKLAVAVAREGCIDETLSALKAAAEVEYMDTLLANGIERSDDKYSGIDESTLSWVRDELSTIASEESAHAALAWRTIEWVCRTDSGACDVVRKDVLNEDYMKKAFRARFGSFEAASDALVELEVQFLSRLIGAPACIDGREDDSCI